MGIGILNPVQHTCPGMDAAGLKRDFGSKLCFHGAVENQRILPFGTPEEVRAEVRRCIDTLAADGTGYILAPCHNLQPDAAGNILAMYDEAHRRTKPPCPRCRHGPAEAERRSRTLGRSRLSGDGHRPHPAGCAAGPRPRRGQQADRHLRSRPPFRHQEGMAGRTCIVVYDGGCGVCSAGSRWIVRLDWLGSVACLPLQSSGLARLGLDPEACMQAMHVVLPGNHVRRGGDAFRAILARLLLSMPLALFLAVPPLPALVRAVYPWFASRRRALSAACGLVGRRPQGGGTA
jgi:predicted DCC family thiol-disulfide oxidoreductase YuxK